MKVRTLIKMLSDLPPDADVRLDDEEYPSIDGAYMPDEGEFDGDPEDGPPPNTVLLEASYTNKE